MGFPKMKNSGEFVAHVKDLLGDIPNVVVKPMFGGHGIFRENVMFGSLARDVMYLRADGDRAAQLKADGSEQFGFEMGGKAMTMPYWTVPSNALDDRDSMTELAVAAFADALAADRKKPKSKRKHKPVN